MHDNHSDRPLYRDLAGEGEEFRRAMAHACSGIRHGEPLAFDPDEASWNDFYERVFAESIAPHFIASYTAAAAGQTERLLELDAAFAERLPAATRERLRAGASAVFEARAGAGAMRLLDRLRSAEPPATFTTAFAAHAASFHVPLLHALIACLAVEWRSADSEATSGLEKSGSWQNSFENELAASPEPVRQILARNLQSWAEVA